MKRGTTAIASLAWCVVTACSFTTSTSGLFGGAAGSDAGGRTGSSDGGLGAGAGTADGGAGGVDAAAVVGDGGTTVSAAYRAIVMEDKPLAYWRFEEKQGDVAIDETGRHAAHFVSGELDAAGVAGSRGVSLRPAVSGRIETRSTAFALSENAAGFAVECWLLLRAVDPFVRIASTESTSTAGAVSSGWFFMVGPDVGPYFTFRSEAGAFVSELQAPVPLQLNRFHHIVVSSDGQVGTLMIDGAVAVTGGFVGAAGANGLLTWGCRLTRFGPDNCIDAILDEAAIYDHALSNERIVAHFAAGLSAGEK